MRTKLLRFISIIMCVAMMFSLVSCKKTKDDDSQPKSVSSEPAPQEDIDSVPEDHNDGENDISDLDDYDDEPYIDDYKGYNYIIDRPDATGSISIGYKEAFGGSDDEDNYIDLDRDDKDEEWDDIGDIDDVVETVFEYPIQSRGVAVSGTTREINIDNSADGILFTDFSGYSCNAFPTQSTLIAQQMAGDSEAFLELQTKRYNDIGSRFCRMWYQIDWMTTDEAEQNGGSYKDYSDNIYDNPDYKNYINGKYDFDSDYFQSVVDYCKMLEETDTEIYLAFGWKIASRIQDWFCEDVIYKKNTAPKDLKAYAQAAAALFKHMRNEEMLTNFNILSFYNEPHNRKKTSYPGADYSTVGDKRVHYYNMIAEMYRVFKADKELNDVKLIGVDHSGNMAINSMEYVSCYINEYGSQYLDAFSFHHYINEGIEVDKTSWDVMMERFTYCVNIYKHPIYITEFYACEVNQTVDSGALQYAWESNYGFDSTGVAYYIAAANTGVRGVFKWAFVGGFLPDPQFFDPANNILSSWIRPIDANTTAQVNLTYYYESMINNYIENDSNVHHVDWKGDDIRVSAFTSKNGEEFSLLVEAKEETNDKTFKVSLTKALNVNSLYVYRYNREIETNGQATIPKLYDTVNLDSSKKSFNYSVDDKYGAYVFTTKAPVKQIELYDSSHNDAIYNYCEKNNTITIIPEFVDNNEAVSSDRVKWEIKRYAGAVVDEDVKRIDRIEDSKDIGTLSTAADGSVTYTPASDAQSGDLIAIRCSLKSNPDRFASAIIEIK